MTRPPDGGDVGGAAVSAPTDAPRRADDDILGRWLWRWLRGSWPLLLVAGAILVTAALTARPPDTGLPLDPASPGDDGTRGLVDVLAAVGRPARVTAPDRIGDADVVLLLRDQLTTAERARLRARVREGVRLVVADPTSELAPDTTGAVGLFDRPLTAGCDVAALRQVGEVRLGFDAALLEVSGDATGCFSGAGGAVLVITPSGRGHIVALGDPSLLTNARLDVADHAPLVVGLLTPAGANEILIIRPTLRTAAQGGQRLGDLVPTWVRLAGVQLLVAFGVLVMWRARRLGRPLPDDAPVRLASAELTTAVGALHARNRTHGAAARRIAADTRRRLAGHVGLPANAASGEVASSVATVTGRDLDTVAAVLDPTPPFDDATLLAHTTALATLEQSLHANLTPPTESSDVD